MTFLDAATVEKAAAGEVTQPGALRHSLDRYAEEAIQQAFQSAFHMTGVAEYLEYYESR